MIFILIIYGLIICELALQCAVVFIAKFFPYVNGFIAGTIIYSYAKPLHSLIPGHSWLSYLVCMCILELVLFVLIGLKYTQKGIITLLCISVPSFLITAIHVTVDSWQMAVLLTVVHLIILGCETYSNIKNYSEYTTENTGFITMIFNALSYCLAAFMLTVSVTYCYWDLYMDSIGQSDSFTITKVGITIIAMTISFLQPVIIYGSQKNKSQEDRKQTEISYDTTDPASIKLVSREEIDELVKKQMKNNMEKLNINTGGTINEQSAVNR